MSFFFQGFGDDDDFGGFSGFPGGFGKPKPILAVHLFLMIKKRLFFLFFLLWDCNHVVVVESGVAVD